MFVEPLQAVWEKVLYILLNVKAAGIENFVSVYN